MDLDYAMLKKHYGAEWRPEHVKALHKCMGMQGDVVSSSPDPEHIARAIFGPPPNAIAHVPSGGGQSMPYRCAALLRTIRRVSSSGTPAKSWLIRWIENGKVPSVWG